MAKKDFEDIIKIMDLKDLVGGGWLKYTKLIHMSP